MVCREKILSLAPAKRREKIQGRRISWASVFQSSEEWLLQPTEVLGVWKSKQSVRKPHCFCFGKKQSVPKPLLRKQHPKSLLRYQSTRTASESVAKYCFSRLCSKLLRLSLLRLLPCPEREITSTGVITFNYLLLLKSQIWDRVFAV